MESKFDIYFLKIVAVLAWSDEEMLNRILYSDFYEILISKVKNLETNLLQEYIWILKIFIKDDKILIEKFSQERILEIYKNLILQ